MFARLKKNPTFVYSLIFTLFLIILTIVLATVGGEFDLLLKRGIREFFPHLFIFVQINVLMHYYKQFKEKKEKIGEIISKKEKIEIIEIIGEIISKKEDTSDVDKIESSIFNKSYLIIAGFIFGIVYLVYAFIKYPYWYNNPQCPEVVNNFYFTSLPIMCFQVFFWFIIYFILGVSVLIILNSVRELSQIGGSKKPITTEINPYSADRCGNLADLSDIFIYLAMCSNTLLILGMTVFLKLSLRWFDIILIAIAFLLIALSYFGAQSGLHKTLKNASERELDKLLNELKRDDEDISTNNYMYEIRKHIKNVETILKINELEKMQHWVFTSKSIYDLFINIIASVAVLFIEIIP